MLQVNIQLGKWVQKRWDQMFSNHFASDSKLLVWIKDIRKSMAKNHSNVLGEGSTDEQLDENDIALKKTLFVSTDCVVFGWVVRDQKNSEVIPADGTRNQRSVEHPGTHKVFPEWLFEGLLQRLNLPK